MGYYIETPGQLKGKASRIAFEHDGQLVKEPAKFSDVPEDKALIVVVDNGPFEAAALAYDEREFLDFTDPDDDRPKRYVLLDKPTAYRLARYNPLS
jgi:hypothetical protein